MTSLNLPQGGDLIEFAVCLIVGAIVVLMYCNEQFKKKPAPDLHANDPWNFVPPPYLTPPQQYVTGFLFYCSVMVILFLAASFFGPDRTFDIVQSANSVRGIKTDFQQWAGYYATFPVMIAFFLICIYPKVPVPRYLDLEHQIRRFAHRIAYIPKNMDTIFNFMRLSDFDLSPQKVDDAWSSVSLRRLTLDAPDLKSIHTLLDRTVTLYALAMKLAGEVDIEGGQELMGSLSLVVFREYRSQIEEIEISLRAVNARLIELDMQDPSERRKSILIAQRELIKSRDFLYVIFACAITGKGMERISDRLHTIGFTSPFRSPPGIPWNPIVTAMVPGCLVLVLVYVFAEETTFTPLPTCYIPPDDIAFAKTVVTIIAANLATIAAAVRIRMRLMNADKYVSESGKGHALAYVNIWMRCYPVGLTINVIFTGILFQIPTFLHPIANLHQIDAFLRTCAAWAIVSASCGVMTAYTSDRPSKNLTAKSISACFEGALMAAVALLALNFAVRAGGPPCLGDNAGIVSFQAYNFILYGGFGFILGFFLPGAMREHWEALANQLPDKIIVLRTDVLPYFTGIQQFYEWLYMRNERLNGKRPVDILAEETGLQQLISFVAQTRIRVWPAPG